MNSISTATVARRRRRLHTAWGTVAVGVTAVATIAVGARTIGVAPPPDEIPMFCPVAAHCVQQLPIGPDLGAPFVHR